MLTNSDFKIGNFEKMAKIAKFSKKFDFERSIFHFLNTFAMGNVFWKAFLCLPEHF